MAKRFSTLLKKLPPWFASPGDEGDVLMGTMGRMVRNLPGQPFPGWSTAESREAVAQLLLPVLQSLPGFNHAFLSEMTGLGYEERCLLMERKQLPPCMAARQQGCYFMLNNDQTCSAMVNEEEHLSMHAYAHGLKLGNVIRRLDNFSSALEAKLTFAFSKQSGYLTSMPSECGEGLQLYVILHLPGMNLSNSIPQVSKALEKLHLNFSPLYPELGEDSDNTYVISTAALPLGSREDMSSLLEETVLSLAEQEQRVRRKLETSPHARDFFLDQMARAYALLRYARKLSYKDALHDLSLLRMGIESGLFTSTLKTKKDMLKELLSLHLASAPSFMACQGRFSEEERAYEPMLRAALFRQFLLNAQLQSDVII